MSALWGSDNPALRRMSDRMRGCCTNGHLMMDTRSPDNSRVALYHCDQRTCPDCQRHRTRGLRSRLELVIARAVARGQRDRRTGLRMITLTMGRRGWLDGDPRGVGPRAAYKASLRALRLLTRSKAFTGHVDGALAVFEWTWEPAGWHPHWHLLCEGDFWEIDALRKTWQGIVGDEVEQVDISHVWRPGRDDGGEHIPAALREATKYHLKPLDLDKPGAVAAVLAWAVESSRLRTRRTLGTWYAALKEKPAASERIPVKVEDLAEALVTSSRPRDIRTGELVDVDPLTMRRALRAAEAHVRMMATEQKARKARWGVR